MALPGLVDLDFNESGHSWRCRGFAKYDCACSPDDEPCTTRGCGKYECARSPDDEPCPAKLRINLDLSCGRCRLGDDGRIAKHMMRLSSASGEDAPEERGARVSGITRGRACCSRTQYPSHTGRGRGSRTSCRTYRPPSRCRRRRPRGRTPLPRRRCTSCTRQLPVPYRLQRQASAGGKASQQARGREVQANRPGSRLKHQRHQPAHPPPRNKNAVRPSRPTSLDPTKGAVVEDRVRPDGDRAERARR